MTDKLRVLAVGSRESRDLVRDALLFRSRSHLLAAGSYWELCALSIRDAGPVSIAVIELCNSASELRRTAEHIRRRWPEAQILLVGQEAEVLEDPLYDQRIPPGLEAAELFAIFERLVKGKRKPMRARRHDSDADHREWT
jgi:hypothetical protein